VPEAMIKSSQHLRMPHDAAFLVDVFNVGEVTGYPS
jgi:hypothetical protein